MTDSIQTTLRLDRIPANVRKDIPAQLCTVCDLWGEIQDRYVKPNYQMSPLVQTKTKWLPLCGIDRFHPEVGEIPYRIDAYLNIPNALTGQNLEHGTSVFAAGVAALELQRIWMAKVGLGRDVLDLLTTDCVDLRGVTITYLFKFSSQAEADHFVRVFGRTGKILNSKCEIYDSTNLTVTLPYRTFTIKIYNKTLLDHCKFPDGAPESDLISDGHCLVRIEVLLKHDFLKKKLKGLSRTSLNSWRDAYAEGLYELIYERTVVKELGLGLKPLRHRAPRSEIYSQLSETESDFLRWVVDGNPGREFRSVVESVTPTKRFSELRSSVLRVARIDADIPWEKHVQLRCFELAPRFAYPGDYVPSESHSGWCFCIANWPALRQRLRAEYERAIAAQIPVAPTKDKAIPMAFPFPSSVADTATLLQTV